MNKVLKLVTLGILIGVIDAIVFVVFEFIVTEGTEYLWTNIFNTNQNRLGVIPIAIILGILYSILVRSLKQKRLTEVETNLFEDGEVKKVKPIDLVTIFLIGGMSLLAGASLGPEASLVGMTMGLGILFGTKTESDEVAKLLSLASMGALLVAFFGSLIPMLVPILVLYKKKKLELMPLLVVLITGITAYLALIVIKGEATGYGTIPVGPEFNLYDLFFAFVLGLLGTTLSLLTKDLIKRFGKITNKVESKFGWIISASVFGLVIGILYFIGGPTIQFSGNEGTKLLMESADTLTITMLFLIIISKLLVTSWSLASGYRGGTVFPSVFTGVAIGLLFGKIDPILSGTGVTLGAISGVMAGLLSPIVGFILIISMIPIQLIGVAAAGLAGAILGEKILLKFNTSKAAEK